MKAAYVIEVDDGGQRAFVTERGGELFLTPLREEAAVYGTELEAKCAKVYVGDNYSPRIVALHAATPACHQD